MNLESADELGKSDSDLGDLNTLSWVNCIAIAKAMVNQCRHALFVQCRGSALKQSTYFPRGGQNSCRDLLLAMNEVTLPLCLPCGSLRWLKTLFQKCEKKRFEHNTVDY